MKILGISAGRKMGNSEIMLKEALMKAQETSGAEVEIIRLHDLKIKPCTGCESCMKGLLRGEEGQCVLKGDHLKYFVSKVSDADGVILSFPCYEILAPGYLLLVANRFLGSGIESRRIMAQKHRVSAMIAVGGSDWVNLTLPSGYMALSMIGGPAKLVDQMLEIYSAPPGFVVLREKYIERAARLGTRVGEALISPPELFSYKGEGQETCPLCHTDIVQVRGDKVVCPICEITGDIVHKDGKLVVHFPEEQIKKSRYSEWGLVEHNRVIAEEHQEWAVRKAEREEKTRKYAAFNCIAVPPPLTVK